MTRNHMQIYFNRIQLVLGPRIMKNQESVFTKNHEENKHYTINAQSGQKETRIPQALHYETILHYPHLNKKKKETASTVDVRILISYMRVYMRSRCGQDRPGMSHGSRKGPRLF